MQHLENGKPKIDDIDGLSHRSDTKLPFTVNAKRKPFKSITEIPSPFLGGIVDEDVLARSGVEANLETQRGCNLRCSYCIYHKDMDSVAYSEVERIIKEVRYVTKRGVKKIRFVDANFSSDKNHAKLVMKGLIRERFKTSLFFELIPGFIDEELAALFGEYTKLHPQNQITIGVGVQTINLKVLKLMRRSIRKEKFEKTFGEKSENSSKNLWTRSCSGISEGALPYSPEGSWNQTVYWLFPINFPQSFFGCLTKFHEKVLGNGS